MKKQFGKAKLFIMAASAGLLLTACQVAPVNAKTVITDVNGAGNKTISMLMLVDGSVQMTADTTSFPGNNNYFYVDDATFENVTFDPKADKVSYISDGYFTNPNHLATAQEIWNEFNAKVESVVPEGFNFSISTVQSANWNDKYMGEAKAESTNTTNEWKAYVYHLSYSWNNVEEYIAKTKKLIGKNYASSELAELDDANTPWVSFTEGEDSVFTWKECYTVNYWSVYDLVDTVMDSELFNRDALGATYHVETSSAFQVALQEYQIGEGEAVKVKIDNTSTTDENNAVIFIEAKGKVAKPATTNAGMIIGIVAAAVVVVAAAIGGVIFFKKKKKKQ